MSSIKTETIIRTIIFFLAIANQILTSTGHSVLPFTDEQVTEYVTLIITAAAAVWAWWKNNSFTKAAIAADEYMEQYKTEETETEDV